MQRWVPARSNSDGTNRGEGSRSLETGITPNAQATGARVAAGRYRNRAAALLGPGASGHGRLLGPLPDQWILRRARLLRDGLRFDECGGTPHLHNLLVPLW